MKSQQNNLSSGDYQREAEITRHRLAGNIDELSDRLTPGQVFDEMLTYARAGGGTFFRTLGSATRENPIPSLLIGAGMMMFLTEKMGLNRAIARKARDSMRSGDGGNGGYGDGGDRGYGDGGRSMASTAGTAMMDSTARMSNAASRAGDTAMSGMRSAADTTKSGLRSAADVATDRMRSATDAATDRMRSATDTAASGMRSAADSAKAGIGSAADSARSGVSRATDFASEQASSARKLAGWWGSITTE